MSSGKLIWVVGHEKAKSCLVQQLWLSKKTAANKSHMSATKVEDAIEHNIGYTN
jgi:hypothetical protein